MKKEMQNIQLQSGNKQNSFQESSLGGGGAASSYNAFQLDKLQEKNNQMNQYPTRYLLKRLILSDGQTVFGGLWVLPNILGIIFYRILKDISIKNN